MLAQGNAFDTDDTVASSDAPVAKPKFSQRIGAMLRRAKGQVMAPAEPKPEPEPKPEAEPEPEPVTVTDPITDPVLALHRILGERAGLPSLIVERLRGDTQAEVEADVRSWQKHLPPQREPGMDFDGGARGEYGYEDDDMNEILRRAFSESFARKQGRRL